jgi:hypothetical protein
MLEMRAIEREMENGGSERGRYAVREIRQQGPARKE